MNRVRLAYRVLVIVATGLTILPEARGAATNVDWIGGGNTSDWYDSANWSAGNVPNNNGWQATISNSVDLVFTNTGNLNLNRITMVGTGKVTFAFGQILVSAGIGFTPAGGLTVGSGGVRMNAFATGNQSPEYLIANGDLEATSLDWDQVGILTQNAGKFDIALFRIPNANSAYRYFTNWSFRDGANTTITIKWTREGTVPFKGAPTFEGGRPDWNVVCHDGDTIWDLRGYGIYADSVTLSGTWNNVNKVGLSNAAATGWVDANSLQVGTAAQPNHFLALANAAVVLRGSGVVYNNYVTNNTDFTLRTNTPFTFHPAAGSADEDTGSEDRNSIDLDPADWVNNFAFDAIEIGDGDSVRLVGTANVGAGNNALYARRLRGLGSGGTVVLNGHNLYLLEAPRDVAFDGSGGGRAYYPATGTVITIR